MKTAVLAAVLGAVLIAAAPDALITPRAELPSHSNANNVHQVDKRQNKSNSDPAFLGWISTSGQSDFSDARSCDFPATLTRSGSYAQCCGPSMPCDFFSTCSGGALFATSTSVFCDWGYCNTAVIVSETAAEDGQSVLGCWAADLGTAPFRLVQDIGSATIATKTESNTASSGASSSRASGTSAALSSRVSGSGASSSSDGTSSATGQASPSSTGAAAGNVPEPVAGLLGLAAGLFALL